ncbi:MAG: hypothetical protein MJ239_04600 [Bacilli bacterium]|nr:hypothetical protein [Bacilli bacterium]
MFYLGIDFGGGSSKATLIDEKGRVLATASSEYETIYGKDGLATQKPDDWYKAAVANVRAILVKGFDPEQIECLCFDAATHTAVLLDENDEVVADSIYWTDTRSVKQKNYLLENYKDYIFEKTKHLPDTIWTLPELMYFRDEQPELYKKVAKVLFAKDYVRNRFAPSFVTDFIEAQGSMMFDFDKREWDEKLLGLASLKKSQMPKIAFPLDVVGYVCEKAAKESGLSTKTKVLVGSTDTAMEIFASGGVKDGDLAIKLATAGRIYMVSNKSFPDKNVINYSHLDGVHYYPGSGTKSCASSLRWFRDTFGGDFASFTEEAGKVPLGSDGLFFHPYLRGELTPYANPSLRGSFFGVSSSHTKAHFVRSIFEGVSFSMLDCLLYLKGQGLPLPEKAAVLGGATSSPVWMQILSDVLDMELIVSKTSDSSFGSALCSAIASGVFSSFEDAIGKSREIVKTVVPNKENHLRYQKLFDKYQEISKFTVDFYKDE